MKILTLHSYFVKRQRKGEDKSKEKSLQSGFKEGEIKKVGLTFSECEHVKRALAWLGHGPPRSSDRGHPKTVSCERVETSDLEEGDVIWCLHSIAVFFPTGLLSGSNLYQVV